MWSHAVQVSLMIDRTIHKAHGPRRDPGTSGPQIEPGTQMVQTQTVGTQTAGVRIVGIRMVGVWIVDIQTVVVWIVGIPIVVVTEGTAVRVCTEDIMVNMATWTTGAQLHLPRVMMDEQKNSLCTAFMCYRELK